MSCHGLKMAYRNLLKYKLQSVICVLGLAGGLSCFTVCNYMLRKELACLLFYHLRINSSERVGLE